MARLLPKRAAGVAAVVVAEAVVPLEAQRRQPADVVVADVVVRHPQRVDNVEPLPQRMPRQLLRSRLFRQLQMAQPQPAVVVVQPVDAAVLLAVVVAVLLPQRVLLPRVAAEVAGVERRQFRQVRQFN